MRCPRLVLAAPLVAGATAPATSSETPAVAVPAIDNVRISPSGDRILAISNRGQHRVLVTTDIATGASTVTYRPSPGTQSLDACGWVSGSRVVCSVFVFPEPGPPWPRERIVRLVAVDHDGSNPVRILDRPPRVPPKLGGVVPQPSVPPDGLPGLSFTPPPRPFLDLEHAVVDPLVDDADHLLVAAGREAQPYRTVYRVNAHTGKARRTVRWQSGILFWHTDQDGRVRAGTGWYEFGHGLPKMWGKSPDEPYMGPTGVVRAGGESADEGWRRVDIKALSRPTGERFLAIPRVLGFSPDAERVYYQGNVDGAGRTALWEADADTFAPLKRLAADETRDISALAIAGRDCGIVGFMHPLPGRPFSWLDPAFETDVEDAAAHVPGDVVAVTSLSADCRLVTLAATDHRSHRSFHLLDRTTGRIRGLGEQYPAVDGGRSKRRNMTWTARDGLALPVAVTTPATGTSVGLVVLLHGSAPDDTLAPLDLWPHYFASRGFTVAAPVVRGFEGYGTTMHASGLRQFARKLREDVADVVSWLADRGIADPDRVCLLGRGRGGHLALAASIPNASAPNNTRCVAALATMDTRRTVRAHDNPFEAVYCDERFACGDWERWAAPQFLLAKYDRGRARSRALGIDKANAAFERAAPPPSADGSDRSPLPDAEHPGFPVLIHTEDSTVHDGDTDAWRKDRDALGVFGLIAPSGAASETEFLDAAAALFDDVLTGSERPPSRD